MSDGPTLSGQLYDQQTGVITPFTETSRRYSGAETARVTGAENDARTEINPTDREAASVRVYSTPDLSAILALKHIWAGKTNIPGGLPPVLTAFDVIWEFGTGTASNTDTPGGASTGESAHLSASTTPDSQNSGHVMPELVYTIKEFWTNRVPVTNYLFYLPSPITEAAIIDRLAQADMGSLTVNPWPIFKPQPLTFVLTGQKIAVAARAKAQQAVSISPDNNTISYTTGTGTSADIAPTVQVRQFPPTLHGAWVGFSGGATKTQAVSATARAQFGGGTNFPARDSGTATASKSAAGSVSPTFIDSTSPTTVPVTGLYLLDYDSDIYRDTGYGRVIAQVINMAIFA